MNTIYQYAFAENGELTDVYCLAKQVPSCFEEYFWNTPVTNIFNDCYIDYATLHVPSNSLNDYNVAEMWKDFQTILPTAFLDENATTAPSAETNVGVMVKRAINADEWSTLVLPFSMSEAQLKATFGDDVELADFTGYEVVKNGDAITSMTINFTDVTAIEANHPYIIKVSDPMNYIEVDNATINATAKPSKTYSNGDLQGSFTGTYVSDFDFYTASEYGHPLFLSGNEFWYATASTKHMKAFHAYFDFNQAMAEAVAAGARITMNIGDAPTGINSLATSYSPNDDEGIYDLQGRRVTAPSKGIYVRNGKKIIMK